MQAGLSPPLAVCASGPAVAPLAGCADETRCRHPPSVQVGLTSPLAVRAHEPAVVIRSPSVQVGLPSPLTRRLRVRIRHHHSSSAQVESIVTARRPRAGRPTVTTHSPSAKTNPSSHSPSAQAKPVVATHSPSAHANPASPVAVRVGKYRATAAAARELRLDATTEREADRRNVGYPRGDHADLLAADPPHGRPSPAAGRADMRVCARAQFFFFQKAGCDRPQTADLWVRSVGRSVGRLRVGSREIFADLDIDLELFGSRRTRGRFEIYFRAFRVRGRGRRKSSSAGPSHMRTEKFRRPTQKRRRSTVSDRDRRRLSASTRLGIRSFFARRVTSPSSRAIALVLSVLLLVLLPRRDRSLSRRARADQDARGYGESGGTAGCSRLQQGLLRWPGTVTGDYVWGFRVAVSGGGGGGGACAQTGRSSREPHRPGVGRLSAPVDRRYSQPVGGPTRFGSRSAVASARTRRQTGRWRRRGQRRQRRRIAPFA